MKVRALLALACVAFHPGYGQAQFFDIGKAIDKAVQDAGKAIDKAAQDTGKTIEKGAQDAGKASEALYNEKKSMDSVLFQLARLPLDRLYALKVWPDLCTADIVDCGSLPGDRVKPFIDVELDRRKATLDYQDKRNAFLVSIGSLIVSGCALLISGFVALRKPPLQKPIET
jgi:hypothetical protein